jgi:Carboxypeptidase regulatory-like domain
MTIGRLDMHIKFNCIVSVSLLFLLLPFQASGPAPGAGRGKLTGTVADQQEGAPIRCAFVFVHSSYGAGDVTVKPDRYGKFNATLTPGLYDVFVAAPGFAPTCRSVRVDAYQTTVYSPRLGADVEHLERDSERVDSLLNVK